MKTKDDELKKGLDRMNALFEWWGVPQSNGNGQMDEQMKRLQTLASDLQKAQGEAYAEQFDALVNVGERVANSLNKLAQCRQPQDAMALGSDVMAAILDGASAQAKTWTDLAQKVQECCAEMTSEAMANNASLLNGGKKKK